MAVTVVQSATNTAAISIGVGSRAMLEMTASLPGAVTSGNTVLVAVSGNPGNNAGQVDLGPPSGSLSYTAGGSLGGSFLAGTLALYFGSNRAASTDTVSRGTLRQQVSTGVSGAGCLYSEDVSGLSAVSPVFSYSVAGGGHFEAIVPVGPGASLRGTNMIAQSTGPTFTISFPAGTQAGDLAIVFYGNEDFASAVSSGWSTLYNPGAATFWSGAIFYKVLTSADITTGTVTVTSHASNDGVLAIATLYGSSISINLGYQTDRQSTGATSWTVTCNSSATYWVYTTYVDASGYETPVSTLGGQTIEVPPNNVLVVGPSKTGSTNPATGWNVYVGTSAGSETKQNTSLLTSWTAAWTEPTSGLISGSAPPVSPVYDSAGSSYSVSFWSEGNFNGLTSGQEGVGIFISTGAAGGTHNITLPLYFSNVNPVFTATAKFSIVVLEMSGWTPSSVITTGVSKQGNSATDLTVTVVANSGTSLVTDWGTTGQSVGAVVDFASPEMTLALFTGDSSSAPTTPTLNGGAYTSLISYAPSGGLPIYLWIATVASSFPQVWILH